MDLRDHGGYCCGRKHIHSMNGATTASIIDLMTRYGYAPGPDADTNKVIEIVISEENDNFEDLQGEIVGAGFVLVAVWDNCSGSRCYMYLHANDWTAYPNGAAVNIVPPAPVAPPPPPPAPAPRVVLSTWHNVLQTGRGAGFDSYAGARAAAPRARSVDRRDVYASGHVRWAQGVLE